MTDLAKLQAENERLKMALKPFAECIECPTLNHLDDAHVVYTPVINARFCITAGDLRKARAALTTGESRE